MATYSGEPTSTKRPGPSLVLSLIMIGIGTVVGITGLAVGITKVVHDINGPRALTPADIHAPLSTGTWQVYASDEFGTVPPISPSEVTVIAPDNSVVPVRELPGGLNETLTTGGRSYQAEVRFTVTKAGEYEIRVQGSPGTDILISKSLGDLAKHAAIWFVLMGLGMLIGFAGVVLLIVGIVRRRNARRPPAYAYAYAGGAAVAGPAPGWYPDPQIPGTSRWWDGTQWTDQTHTG